MSVLPDPVVRKVYLKPIGDVNEFIREQMAGNPDMKILIVKDAGHTVIKYRKE
jgi:hypothetical protein